jgi:hypothetical protein
MWARKTCSKGRTRQRRRGAITPAGREQDHDEIASDSSSIAFDAGIKKDMNAPLETEND